MYDVTYAKGGTFHELMHLVTVCITKVIFNDPDR